MRILLLILGGEFVGPGPGPGPAAPAQRLASALALETNSKAFYRTIRNAVSVDAAGAPCPVVGAGVQGYPELRAGLHLPGPELQRPLKTSHVRSIVSLSRMKPFPFTQSLDKAGNLQ